MTHVVVGDDGLARCPWGATTPDYIAYHDTEWGRPVHGDVAIFERLTLEAFQSGLAWITILRKREGFRAAFAGFDPVTVAAYGEADRARLLADAGIVRNRAKVDATIANARALVDLLDAEGRGAGPAGVVVRPAAAPLPPAHARRRPGHHPGVGGAREGAQAPRLRLRGADDGVRRHAGHGPRRRPPRRLPRPARLNHPPRGHVRSLGAWSRAPGPIRDTGPRTSRAGSDGRDDEKG